MEEVIDEPVLDLSHYNICSEFSEEIQYYYKIKYPEVYSLGSSTVVKLLDNTVVYSELEESVESYIRHISQSLEANKNLGLMSHKNDLATKRSDYVDRGQNTLQKQDSEEANGKLYRMSSADLTLYDSVHSIKVPLRTYKNKKKNGRQNYRKGCCSY